MAVVTCWWRLVIVDGCWRFIVVLGMSWVFLLDFGGSWWFLMVLIVFDSSCWFLSCSWQFLAVLCGSLLFV